MAKLSGSPLATILVLGLIVNLFSMPIVHAQALRREQNLTVFDVNGNKVGNVIDINNSVAPATVAFTVNKETITLNVNKAAIFGQTLLFEDAFCNTTPFIRVTSFLETRALFTPVGVGTPGNTLYVADLSAPREFIDPLSAWNNINGICEGAGGVNLEAYQLSPVLQLNDFFTPPYHAE